MNNSPSNPILIFLGSYIHLAGLIFSIHKNPHHNFLLILKKNSGLDKLIFTLKPEFKHRISIHTIPEGTLNLWGLLLSLFYFLKVFLTLRCKTPSKLYIFNNRYTLISFALFGQFKRLGSHVCFYDLEKHLHFENVPIDRNKKVIRKAFLTFFGTHLKIVRNQWWQTVQEVELNKDTIEINKEEALTLFASMFENPTALQHPDDYILVDLPIERMPGIDIEKTLKMTLELIELIPNIKNKRIFYKNHPYFSETATKLYHQLELICPNLQTLPSHIPSEKLLSNFANAIAFSPSGFNDFEGKIFDLSQGLCFIDKKFQDSFDAYFDSYKFSNRATVISIKK